MITKFFTFEHLKRYTIKGPSRKRYLTISSRIFDWGKILECGIYRGKPLDNIERDIIENTRKRLKVERKYWKKRK
ncbi:MAG: hypothetical protein ABW148_18570 [Sedimenticola sp.]